MDRIGRLRAINEESYIRISPEFNDTRRKPWSELIELGAVVREGDCVLDLGCGNGRLLKALPSVNFSYTGIDQNDFLLAKAAARFPDRSFIRSSLEDVVLPPQRYDVIFCIAALHHIPGREFRQEIVRKCYDALKPGGRFIATVWNLWQGKYLLNFFSRLRQKADWNDLFVPWRALNRNGAAGSGKSLDNIVWRYLHCFTKAELGRLASRAGFRDATIRAYRKESGKGFNYTLRARKSK